MGQTQSKDCADNLGRLAEKEGPITVYEYLDKKISKNGIDYFSVEDEESDINILQRLTENGGPVAMYAYIDDRLNGWKKEQVKFAITGHCATGKSTFINTIRNLKPGDDDFARAEFGDTTSKPKLYIHPKNANITFCELPGYSSITFKKEAYISEMKISYYDFVFIFFNNVLSEDDIWLVGELRRLGKPFSLVRSKIDRDIYDLIYDDKDRQMIIPEIKRQIKIAFNGNLELKDTEGIFLISSRKPELGEWSDLMTYVEESIDGLKAQTLLISLDCITKKIVERKYQMVKKRLVVATVLATGIEDIPMPCVGFHINVPWLCHELHHYMRVFGVIQQRVYSLKDFDSSLLKCTYLLKPDKSMIFAIVAKIGTVTPLCLATSFTVDFLPMVGTVLSSATDAAATYRFLDNTLRDITHDALQIYEHIVNTNADHRM